LQGYISLYERIWLFFSMPLRRENSIYFRDGIDPDLEMLAMCNYTAYANLARALEKINSMEDDLKFSEEIWANLQRAVEVGQKAADAFDNVYTSSTGRAFKLDRRQLESAVTQIKKYRTYDPRRLTGVSVYREVGRDFSVGDRIQFTARTNFSAWPTATLQ
jgi:hypothetical protein